MGKHAGSRRLPLLYAGSARRAHGRLVAVLAVLIGALTMAAAPPAPAREQPPLSGTIISGVLTTGPAVECGLQPDCLPWLQSGCQPALAGSDPAWLTAIVDVTRRADGRTRQTLVIRTGPPHGRILGGVFVQFWRSDCTEVRSASWHSFYDCGPGRDPYRPYGPRPPCEQHRTADAIGHRLDWVRTRFRIPRGVAWMTISANDNINIRWSLT